MTTNDWNFQPLIHKNPSIAQRDELWAAIVYEYARESDSIRKLAQEYASLPADLRNDKFSLHRKNPLIAYFMCVCPWEFVFWPEFFPQTPWLTIPRAERDKRIKSCLASRSPEFLLKINELDSIDPLELPTKGCRHYSYDFERLIVEVNWGSGSNNDIIAAFGKHIRENRPPGNPPPRGDASRQNVIAAFLTRLAQLRLLGTSINPQLLASGIAYR